MTLAQVQATIGIVALIMATWAGMIIGVALWFPKQSKRASEGLQRMPWACGAMGLGLTLTLIIGFVLLNSPARLLGALVLLGLSTLLCLGGSGMARLMGERINELSGQQNAFSALVRGGVVFSLALGFPFIGWLLIAPLSIIFQLGAGLLALLPVRTAAVPPLPPTQRSDYDLMERQGAI